MRYSYFQKKTWYPGHTFSRNRRRFLCPIFTKIIFFQDVPIYFLIFFEVFWYNKNYKYGAPGLGKSRNHEKS